MSNDSHQLIAVDVGNSAIKLGRFLPPAKRHSNRLEEPDWVTRIDLSRGGFLNIVDLEDATQDFSSRPLCWYVASVNGRVDSELSGWVARYRPQDQYLLLEHGQFPISIDVEMPQRVGTDRLAGAVAANELRSPPHGAITVDAGTAVTVDVVSEDGVFRGGAIFPGVEMGAVALSSNTDALPTVEGMDLTKSIDPIGKSTAEAIRSGIFWGCVGAIRELVSQMSVQIHGPPDIFFTGGAGPHLAQLFDQKVQVDPNLVLRGIALTGRLHRSQDD